MENTVTEPRSYRIDNVELNWPKLVQAVSPFNVAQWELQIATTDKAVADKWTENHLTVKKDKNDDSKYIVQLKRKVLRANGKENGKVKVVGRDAKPMDSTNLGNGSKGNVIVYQYPYDTMGRKGIGTSLEAVQILDFVEYQPTGGFSAVEPEKVVELSTDNTPEEPPKKISKKKNVAPKSLESVVKDW
tara:strand:- start:9984 stop:10547 length:564 start_codon:yes stop_codon:yes gene_type:complete